MPICRSRFHPLPWFACAAVFLALGVRQPAFLGVGLAFLGLALGAGRRP